MLLVRSAAGWKLSRRLAAGAAIALMAATGAVESASNTVAVPGATVEDFLSLVKNFNPELTAAALDTEEAAAKIAPARTLDGPTVTRLSPGRMIASLRWRHREQKKNAPQ